MALHELSRSADAGTELDYVEGTSDVAFSSSVEATPTTIITGNDVVVDGSTSVIVTFYCRGIQTGSASGNYAILNLHVSTNSGSSYSDIGRMFLAQNPGGGAVLVFSGMGQRKLTPAAGRVRYRMAGWTDGSSATVQAGAGGAGVGMPMFLRVEKV